MQNHAGGAVMKALLCLVGLVVLLPCSALADFSRSQAAMHPRYPGSGPFIIEISGTWPNDCHPGEQKPVVESFDGRTAEIGFEIVVVHVTCNTIDTPYRSLVDMSAAVRATRPLGDAIDIRVSFQGETLTQTLQLACPDENDCSDPVAGWPRLEPGLYSAAGLANQGLLVARQNAATAIYPLGYGESGRGEWLFSGNLVLEDTFFTEVYRLTGGDCFGCEPSGAEPQIEAIGHLTVLVDDPGAMQVKIDDGLFTEYRSTVFGYEVYAVGAGGEWSLFDLAGRWGIRENRGSDPPLGDLTEFFPGAFDIVFEAFVPADSESRSPGQVSYLVTTPTGGALGQLFCRGDVAGDGSTLVCEFIDPTDAAEPLFLFYQEGPSSLAIEYGRAVIAVGTAPGGKAVRLD
jgi:hypothetical protein